MKLEKYFPYLACVLFSLMLLVVSGRYFPLSEGWWQTYAYLMDNGWKPYVDFPLVTPPLFAYYNMFVMKFTQSFLAQRIIGIGVFTGILCLMARWLACYFPKPIAWMAALFAVLLRVSDPVFIANDYHTMVDLIIILILLCSVGLQDLSKRVSFVARYVMLGVLLAILTFVKQNIGVFLTASFCTVILLMRTYSFRKKLAATVLLCTTCGVAILAISFLCSPDLFTSLFGQMVDNDAKGSKMTILTRLISDPGNYKFILMGVAIFALTLLMQAVERLFALEERLGPSVLRASEIIFLLCCGLLIFLKSNMEVNSVIMMLSISACFTVIVHIFWRDFINAQGGRYSEHLITVFPLLALAYCNTHTATFNYVGMFFVLAFCIGFIADKCGLAKSRNLRVVQVLLLGFGFYVGMNKAIHPYNWWGLEQDVIYQAKYGLPYEQIAGYRVDKKTFTAYSAIKEAIDDFAPGKRDVYLFPNIPIFYYLHSKFPPYNNLLQWFDFVTDRQILKEFDAFEDKLPPLIVFLEPPTFVYEGHMALRKMRLKQEMFVDRFNELLAEGKYSEVYYSFYHDSFAPEIPVSDKRITRTLVVTSPSLVDKDYSSVARMLGFSDFEVESVSRNSLYLQPEKQRVQLGDRVTISMAYKVASRLALNLGHVYKEPSYFTIRILVRSDNPGLKTGKFDHWLREQYRKDALGER